MKLKRLLSLMVVTIISFSYLSLTAYGDISDLNWDDFDTHYKSSLDKSVSDCLDLGLSPTTDGYYAVINDHDTYKKYVNSGIITDNYLATFYEDQFDKSFFDKNLLIATWLYGGESGHIDMYDCFYFGNNGNNNLYIDYVKKLQSGGAFWVKYNINLIAVNRSKAINIDFSKIDYSMIIPENDHISAENAKPLNMVKLLDYNSKISTDISFNSIIDNRYKNNYCIVIDNYDDYISCGLKEKNKEFFDDNLLLVNRIHNNNRICNTYVNNGIVRNADNTLTMSYKATWDSFASDAGEYVTDIIELKKSDVKDVDFSKLDVKVRNVYKTDDSTEELTKDTYGKIDMSYIDIRSIFNNKSDSVYKRVVKDSSHINSSAVNRNKLVVKKAMKQAKIKKLKAKSKAKKKIFVSWKKVKKAKGYQVQVSSKKQFKKSVYKKLTSKNKLTIKSKNIKSGKTYYVRARAYATYKGENGKTKKVYSKWSKQLKKVTVK